MAERTSTLKIMVSTDNHLGVWEKDETRRDDSFNAFTEVLHQAQLLGVDFVLLGGDLFHENTPSRSTLVRTMQIITRFTLNDTPVSFRILSDQDLNFVSGCANCINPNINVGLPIFTIHGNHDDPSGHDNLSAVDILSSCNLINYFGKAPVMGANAGSVKVDPVLIQKGNTRLALYGLGAIRDERLGRLFQTPGAMKWLRVRGTPDMPAEQWFNMFVLHQNRVPHTAGGKNSVSEQHLPAWMDVVIWGHEHECRADPEPAQQGRKTDRGAPTVIIQPGSTVATALSEGESVPKHAVLLEIEGLNYRHTKIRLASVRPFVFEHVALSDAGKDAAGRPRIDVDKPATVSAFLEEKVQEAMARVVPQADVDGLARNGKAPPALLPLVRLRVDYSGFSTINSQRFGQQFVGRVANPQDMLIWQKPKKAAERKLAPAAAASMLRPEALDQTRIEDLIAENLGKSLRVLDEADLVTALQEFVDKDEKSALADCLNASLADTQRQVLKRQAVNAVNTPAAAMGLQGEGQAEEDRDIERQVEEAAAARKAERESKASECGRGDMRLLPPSHGGPPQHGATGPPGDAGVPPATSGRTTPTARTPARGGARAARSSKQATIAEAFGRGRGTSQASTAPARGVKAPAALHGHRAAGIAAAVESDDDLVDDGDDDDGPAPPPPAAGKRKAPQRRAAAKRMRVDSDDDAGLSEDSDEVADPDEENEDNGGDDEDVVEESPPPRRTMHAHRGGAPPATRAARAPGTRRARGATTKAATALTPPPEPVVGSVAIDVGDDYDLPSSGPAPAQPAGTATSGARRVPGTLAAGSQRTTNTTATGTTGAKGKKNWGTAR